jgi:hypothetical protein
MVKNVKSTHAIYIATACVVVAIFVLWAMVIHSVKISFVGRQEQVTFHVLAYVQLSLLVAWMVIRNDLIHKGLALSSKREQWLAVVAFVIGPFIFSNVLMLLFPLVANNLAHEVTEEGFTYVTAEPYGRTSRGLVQLKLLDDKGGELWVVFKKERVEKLALKCGDTLATTGRNSFLGYVIDSEAKASGIAKPCPQG